MRIFVRVARFQGYDAKNVGLLTVLGSLGVLSMFLDSLVFGCVMTIIPFAGAEAIDIVWGDQKVFLI